MTTIPANLLMPECELYAALCRRAAERALVVRLREDLVAPVASPFGRGSLCGPNHLTVELFDGDVVVASSYADSRTTGLQLCLNQLQ